MTGLKVSTDLGDDPELFGKTLDELQSNIKVRNNAISGTLHYVDDYSSAFGPGLDSGNYIALHAEVPDVEDVTITVKVTNAVTLDSDGNMILRIADKNSQTITVVASKDGYESVTKVFKLVGLTCESAA